MQSNWGFTLSELVLVFITLGLLGAVAIPQFVKLTDASNQGAVDGVAGALNSAAALNYAACNAGSAECYSRAALGDCSGYRAVLTGGTMPSGFTLPSTALNAIAGGAADCIVTHTSSGLMASFTMITPN